VKKKFIEKNMLFSEEMSFLLAMGHDDEGWVGFAFNLYKQWVALPLWWGTLR